MTPSAFISLPLSTSSSFAARDAATTAPSIAAKCSPFVSRNRAGHARRNPHPPAALRMLNGAVDDAPLSGEEKDGERQVIRIAIPSKGGILEDTKQLLAEVGINVQIKNPRQYVASLKGLEAEVWLQRPADIVRKVRHGHIDLGFTGYDLVAEHGGKENSIVSVHERLAYGECRLSVGVPMEWTNVSCMTDLRDLSASQVLRIATKYKNETARFMSKFDITNYEIVNMDGALEASTQMGTADCIIDIVSSGITLRENLLKEIDDGTLLNSSIQLIGNRRKLQTDVKLRKLTKEILERIEAHLLGKDNFNIIANIRGSSMVDVSRRLATYDNLRGVDGPTISPVVPSADSNDGMYAISIVVPKDRLYSAIQQLRNVGGSGVTVMPVSFIFPQTCLRWETLMKSLGIKDDVEDEVQQHVKGRDHGTIISSPAQENGSTVTSSSIS